MKSRLKIVKNRLIFSEHKYYKIYDSQDGRRCQMEMREKLEWFSGKIPSDSACRPGSKPSDNKLTCGPPVKFLSYFHLTVPAVLGVNPSDNKCTCGLPIKFPSTLPVGRPLRPLCFPNMSSCGPLLGGEQPSDSVCRPGSHPSDNKLTCGFPVKHNLFIWSQKRH